MRLALEALEEHGIRGEVVVADNGSEDGSAELAEAAGARVVHEPRRGYGSAYLAGFAAARGRLHRHGRRRPHLRLRRDPALRRRSSTTGADLVMGDRMDNIAKGAMPWHHRYVGNPILSGLLNALYRTGVRDAHCGMRAVRRVVAPRDGPPDAGHGVRLGDGDPRREGGPRHPPVPDQLLTRVAASRSSRPSATAGATSASCSSTAPRTSSSCRVCCSACSGRRSWPRWPGGSRSSVGSGTFTRSSPGRCSSSSGCRSSASACAPTPTALYFMGERDPWFERMRRRYRLEHGLAARRAGRRPRPRGGA